MSGLVSVIIPTRNRPELLCQAIQSVQAQSYKDIELLIIDDGSDPPVPQTILGWIDRGRIINHQTAIGVSRARNAGILAARGEFIAFLDDDDVWLPDKLALQIAVMNRHPDVGLCGGGCEYIDGRGETTSGPHLRAARVSLNELFLSVSMPGCTSNALVRSSCLAKVGLFDTRLTRAEDWDLWVRIALHYKVRVVEAVTVQIRAHTQSKSTIDLKEVLKGRSKVHSHIPSKKLARQAYALTYSRLASICLSQNNILEALYYMGKSFFAWPLPIPTEKRRVRSFLKASLGLWKAGD